MRAILALAILTLASAGCSRSEPPRPEPAQPEVQAAGRPAAVADADRPTLRLYVFNCGEADVLDLGIFDAGGAYAGRRKSLAVTCFLVRHPEGDLIWDAGLPDSISESADGIASGSFRLRAPKTLAGQIAELGLAPAEIEYFSASHSHFDHVGNGNLFAGATFIVQRAERAHMFRDEARADAQAFSAYGALEAAKTLEIEGDHDVFGDGSVRIVSTPGHTPGHSVLLVNLRNAGPILLTGDLYHFREARERRTIPVFNTDAEQTLRSMDRFEALAEETGARVLIQHEPEDYASIPHSPDFLD
jgi:glyoxylase-like metal-dependent hydrolase (beta-lactamase superfamily II)